MAELLRVPNERVKLINGPEIVSKFLGESERNLRDLFAGAIADQDRRGAHATWDECLIAVGCAASARCDYHVMTGRLL